jgi:hypothetical protein
MRVLFLSHTLASTSGAAYKVVAVASEWQRQGHSVWLASTREPRPRPVDEVSARLRRSPAARGLGERIAGEVVFRALYPSLFARVCAQLRIDLIYSRELPPAPGLRALIRGTPFVLEINGDVAREVGNRSTRARYLGARALQLASADGVVFVSRELKRACQPEPARSIVLANPCLPSSASTARPIQSGRPSLVLIGYAKHDWSGMDKIAGLASALPEFDFVVIGASVPGPGNLRCFPALTQAEADRVMLGCTVGLGPLALHRKGMFEASPLKSRNYLALGLPVIQSYEDTDLSEADGCVLELPNRDDGLPGNLDRVREFVWRAFSDPSLSQRALALANGRLSLRAKEQDRLRFLESCRRSD